MKLKKSVLFLCIVQCIHHWLVCLCVLKLITWICAICIFLKYSFYHFTFIYYQRHIIKCFLFDVFVVVCIKKIVCVTLTLLAPAS